MSEFYNPESDVYPQGAKELTAEFLTKVMTRLRHDRPVTSPEQQWYVRYDEAMGGTFAQLWFLTRGCTWDRRGECTMCNYGHTATVEPKDMVSYVQAGLESINRPIDELYVSPSGSLFDELEVPADARQAILQLVDNFPCRRFSFESRPETITNTAVLELRDTIPNKQVSVGFGLESASQWVLSHCINKPNAKNSFKGAMTRIHGLEVYANTSLGTAFLSPGEAIDDSVRSIEWVLANGADLAIVFPIHVKGHTLLEWLNSRNLYKPPSLWSLVEVLQRLNPSQIPKVNISWYKADYGTGTDIIASPDTCSNCIGTVLEVLDAFRAQPSVDLVDYMRQLHCECRLSWSRDLEKFIQPRIERVSNIYRMLADDLKLTDWWLEKLPAIVNELSRDETNIDT